MKLYETIFRRQSIRKYQPEALPVAQLDEILAYTKNLHPLHSEITTNIELADAAQVKGLVSTKAPHYLLIYSEKKEGYLENAGFLLQQVDLYLSSLGLGSCWLGMAKTTLPQKNGLAYVIMLAFGKAQGNPHREGISAFKRKTMSEIASGSDDRLEAARLAPSATNSQPWYFSCKEGRLYVYRKNLGKLKAAMYGTMNQVDMGITLCHLWLASAHQNRPFTFTSEIKDAPDVTGYTCIGQVR